MESLPRRLHLVVTRAALGALLLATVGAADCVGDGSMSIHDVEPRQGAVQAEQPVKITGTGFRHDVGYRIYFGNKRSRTVTLIDEQTMLASAPSHDEAGPVDITVLADSGEAFRIRDGFTYANLAGPGQAEPEKKGNLAY